MMTARVLLWFVLFVGLGSQRAWCADVVRYVSKPGGSKVTIQGTSTIHDWVTEGRIIGGFFEVEDAFRTNLSLSCVPSLLGRTNPPRVEVFIPVTSLKSTVAAGREKMDEVMREAMRAGDHPRITYKLTSIKPAGDVPETGSPVRFATKGELQVAGVTNVIEMDVTMERLDGDRIKFSGTKQLKMTDFKIAPPAPKLALGLIRTGDEVTIRFEWIVGL
ncbi:MAG: YceI family protein [Verrucomicrobiae bacterium]|nr:YceI family protein [Verrucomicrobiae bacterium]